MLVGGTGPVDSLPTAEFRDRVVLYVTDWTQQAASGRFSQLGGSRPAPAREASWQS